MENIDNNQNEEDNSSNKRSRRTPSKFGNYFEFEEVVEEEEEEKEEADEDDSDEDPSWDDKKGVKNSFSKGYVPPEDEDDDDEDQDFSDDEEDDDPKRKKGRGRGRGSMVNVRGRGRGAIPNSGVILNNSRGISYGAPPQSAQTPSHAKPLPPNLSTIPPHLMSQMRSVIGQQNSGMMGMSGMTMGQQSGGPIIHDSRIASIQRDSALQQIYNAQQQQQKVQQVQQNSMNWRGYPISVTNGPTMPNMSTSAQQQSTQQQQQQQMGQYRSMTPEQQMKMQNDIRYQEMYRQQQQQQQQQAKQQDQMRSQQMHQQYQTSSNSSNTSNTTPSSTSSFDPNSILSSSSYSRNYYGGNSGETTSTNSSNNITSPSSVNNSATGSNFVPFKLPQFGTSSTSNPNSSLGNELFRQPSPQPQQSTTNPVSNSATNSTSPTLNYNKATGQSSSPPLLSSSANIQNSNNASKSGIFDSLFRQWESGNSTNNSNANNRIHPLRFSNDPLATINSFFSDEETSGIDISSSGNNTNTPSTIPSNSTTATSGSNAMANLITPSSTNNTNTTAPPIVSFPTTTSGIPPSYLTNYTGPSTSPSNASSLLSSNRGGYPSLGGTSSTNAYNSIPSSVNNYSRYPNVPNVSNVPGYLYSYGNTAATNAIRNPSLPPQQQQQQPQQGAWGQMGNNPNLMRTSQLPQQQQQQHDLYQRNLAYRPPIIPGYPGPMGISGIPPEHLIQDKEDDDEEEEAEEEDNDVDPQEKKLNTLVKQCEQYATQIRDVVGHWQEKSLGNDKEMKGSILEENPEEVQNLELIKQPDILAHELRSYQLVGLNWLYLLHQQKINGILADEMGLGKTIQTISFFALLKEKVDMKKPHLVIVPATALENWVREFAEWCPSFKVEMYHGSAKDRESLRKKLIPKDGKYEFDVLITTYNLCVNKVDRVKFFKKFDFGYIVLDEAHNIKNVSSLRYQSLLKLAFRAEFRLMLTGTPLQNNLNELWALLNFLMPNIFGDTKEFKDLLWPEDDEHNNENNIEVQRLKRILSPFLLRRLKSEVLTKLPEKTEKLVWCGFTPFQRELYEKTYQSSRTKYHNYAIKAEENREFRERREKGNNSDDDDLEVINEQATSFKSEGKEPLEEKTLHHILMQLRKAANNALLFRHYYDDDKIDQITQILREEELNKAAKSEEENSALLNKKRKIATEDNSTKKVKTENGGEEENKEEAEVEEEEEESTKNTEEVNPLTTTNGEECGVCGEIGDLLLCDGPCIRGFHLKCIGLEAQPETDKWYCDDCDYLVKDSTLLEAPATEDQDKFVSIIEAVENCQDKNGRYKSELFIYLPAKREYPDYYEVIKTPISLHMLKRRHYQSREHFRDEFFQLVKNAHTYNTPNSQVYRDANSLEKVFRKEFTNYFGSALLPAPTSNTRSSTSSTVNSTSHSTADAFDYSELELEALFEDIDEEDDDDEDDKPTKKRKKTSSRAKKNTDNEDVESFGGESSAAVSRRTTRSRRGQSSNSNDDFPMSLLEEPTTRRKSSRNTTTTTASSKSSNKKSGNNGGGSTSSSAMRKAKLSEPFLTCRNILEDLMDQDDAIPFNAPVDATTTPDYYKIVKTPMDFGSVWSKLNRKEYSSPEEFIDDVRLVFDNCLLYNAPSSQIGLVAQQLWSFFKRQCKKQGIKVDSNVILLHKKMKSEDLSTLPEELKLKSDMEIHQFCRSYDSLKHLCLPDDQLFHSSGKLEALKKKLLKFHAKQNRVLIFSQFTQILNILEDFLARLGFKFLRLDGSTPVLERQLMIDDFNHNRDIFVFLLSTRAGGLGINLTSADVCIFHDIDWNPEMDRQAEARIHRIGQMKPVKIVKLLTKDTVDEYIFRMAQNKKERNDLIMSENDKVITEEKLSIAQVLSSIFTQPETKVESITEPKTE